jgi:hypothetical protein
MNPLHAAYSSFLSDPEIAQRPQWRRWADWLLHGESLHINKTGLFQPCFQLLCNNSIQRTQDRRPPPP